MRAALEQVIVRRKWDPRRLGPVALWIDPSDTATMFQSNAGTTTVTDTSVCGFAGDKSGAAFNLTSTGDDTTRPTWNNNSGLPYLNFDGTNDALRRLASLGSYAAGAFTIAFAMRSNSNGQSRTLFGEAAQASSNGFYILARSAVAAATSNGPFIATDAGVTTNNLSPTTVNVYDGTDKVVIFTDSGSIVTPYLNGVVQATGSYTRSGAVCGKATARGAVFINGANAAFFAGRIYGVLGVNRVLPAGEIASLNTYLGAKMGLIL